MQHPSPPPSPPTPSPSTKLPAPSIQARTSPVGPWPSPAAFVTAVCERACVCLPGSHLSCLAVCFAACLCLCLACCNIISTRFCRPDHCDLLTSAPAKAATKHNPQRSNTPARSNHPSSIGRLPPARRPPLRLPPPLHPAPIPATLVQGVPCQQSLPRAFQNLSLFGAATALPHPGRGLPCRPRLARSFSPCIHCLALLNLI